MTTLDPAVYADDLADGTMPASAQCHVHLGETPAGWVLTITVDRQAAGSLTGALTEGHRLLQSGELSMAITPNLVPGEPFESVPCRSSSRAQRARKACCR